MLKNFPENSDFIGLCLSYFVAVTVWKILIFFILSSFLECFKSIRWPIFTSVSNPTRIGKMSDTQIRVIGVLTAGVLKMDANVFPLCTNDLNQYLILIFFFLIFYNNDADRQSTGFKSETKPKLSVKLDVVIFFLDLSKLF